METHDSIPLAVAENTLDIVGIKVKVYTLDNGERVIDAEDVEKLFAWLATPGDRD